ncbi:MAG: hypothetical protein V1789_09470 [PVC group bacterium]
MKNTTCILVGFLAPVLGILLIPQPVMAQGGKYFHVYNEWVTWTDSGSPNPYYFGIRDELGGLLKGTNPTATDPAWNGLTGDAIQIIYVGDDGIISPPDASGNPTGDDHLFTTTVVGWGISWAIQTDTGHFAYMIYYSQLTDTTIYTRAFNAPELAEATFYGDSTYFIVIIDSEEDFPVNQYGLLVTDQSLDSLDDDGDGANNSWEKSLATDRNNPDSDGDNLLDGEELEGRTLPANRIAIGYPDIGDITFNVASPGIPVTNPNSTNTDGDKYSDYQEVVNLGSDPTDPFDPPPPTMTATPAGPTPNPTPKATPSPSPVQPSPSAPPTPATTATPAPQPTATPEIVVTATPTPTPSPRPTAFYQVMGDSDFNGDGTTDIAIFRDSLWAVRGLTRVYYGRPSGDLPVPGDYDGDGTSDIAVFRPAAGLWAIRGGNRIYFGISGDLAVPDDYDSDGTIDIAIFRPSSGLWAIRGLDRLYYGSATDAPIPADYTGDGLINCGIYRRQSGLWAIRDLTRIYYGRDGDNAVPGDFDGDGTAEIGLFRQDSGLWVFRGVTRAYFGRNLDQPASADYGGFGTVEIGIFRPSSGLWAIRGITRCYFGGSSDDIPLAR